MSNDRRSDLLPGTLELLVLKTLSLGELHGYGIAQYIQRLSRDVLQVEEGSLYPALQRLQLKGLIKSKWGQTTTRRRARFYTITAAGRKQLGAETTSYERVTAAMARILNAQ
ncbi:MAG TPA: PadR family transcriptional regulator [Gemmatimonadaceae bacterium]|nr:PadR family transcriptional regulator [Gemmatimonadaceae bacterium]